MSSQLDLCHVHPHSSTLQVMLRRSLQLQHSLEAPHSQAPMFPLRTHHPPPWTPNISSSFKQRNNNSSSNIRTCSNSKPCTHSRYKLRSSKMFNDSFPPPAFHHSSNSRRLLPQNKPIKWEISSLLGQMVNNNNNGRLVPQHRWRTCTRRWTICCRFQRNSKRPLRMLLPETYRK